MVAINEAIESEPRGQNRPGDTPPEPVRTRLPGQAIGTAGKAPAGRPGRKDRPPMSRPGDPGSKDADELSKIMGPSCICPTARAQNGGFRPYEVVIAVVLMVVAIGFAYLSVVSHPEPVAILAGLAPSFALYIHPDECPVDCIYEGARALYIHPDECVDCGACEPERSTTMTTFPLTSRRTRTTTPGSSPRRCPAGPRR
jgi:hypothetical protein